MLLRKKVILLILLVPFLLPAAVHDYREHSNSTYADDCKVLQSMYERNPENLEILGQIIKIQYALEDFESAANNCAVYLRKKKTKEIHYIYILSLSLQSRYDRASQEFSIYKSLYKVSDKEEKELSDKLAIIIRNDKTRANPSSKKAEWGTGKTLLGIVPGSDVLIGYDNIDKNLFAYSAKDRSFTGVPSLPDGTDYSRAISLSFSDDLSLLAGSFVRGNRTEILISSRSGSYYSNWERPAELNEGRNNSSAAFASGKNLFFVSDRADKDLDIFYAKKITDRWEISQITQLDTNYDESAVSLSYDKKTLYFASNAYSGMGGFDLYSSEISYGSRVTAGTPVNIKNANSFRNASVPYSASNGSIFFNHIVSGNAYVYEYSTDVVVPVREVPVVDTTPEVVARRLMFKTGSAVILRESYPYLNEIADYLRANPGKKLILTGHTDITGTDVFNRQLSIERARSVAAYITARGINPSRITVRGKGASSPIASNETEEGRARNRRVEIQITD